MPESNFSLGPETLRALVLIVGCLGLLATLVASWITGESPDPTLTVTFGGLIPVGLAVPSRSGGRS